jgi:hypothetical protein
MNPSKFADARPSLGGYLEIFFLVLQETTIRVKEEISPVGTSEKRPIPLGIDQRSLPNGARDLCFGHAGSQGLENVKGHRSSERVYNKEGIDRGKE